MSRKRASSDVKRPRRFVLYFLPPEDEVVVSRVLHEARDLARHVPHDLWVLTETNEGLETQTSTWAAPHD